MSAPLGRLRITMPDDAAMEQEAALSTLRAQGILLITVNGSFVKTPRMRLSIRAAFIATLDSSVPFQEWKLS